MMKKFLIITLIFISIHCIANAQVVSVYKMNSTQTDRTGIVGNGITDLLWQDSVLYLGTGYGLGITRDNGSTWQNFTPSGYGGKGGISAISVTPGGTIWIATGYDTTVQEGDNLSAGGGLRYLEPGSSSWQFIPQPMDARDDTEGGKRPTTTNVQNITFDIAVLDTQIWIASFGGGVRRSLDSGQSWEVITTDGLPFSSLDNLNHRGFSLTAENGNIWVGTADGISKSADGGSTWERFVVEDQTPVSGGLSGGWIIALNHNPCDGSIWAICLSTGGSEFNSVCRSTDGGLTWRNLLTEELNDGTFARNMAFSDSVVYVATEKGLYKSVDNGENWFVFPAILDKVNDEQLLTNVFYSCAATAQENGSHTLWAGSADGLARTDNNGYDWTVFRSFVSTRQRTEPAVYAYPNPFSPARERLVRFQFDISSAVNVQIDIFNFALEKVVTITEAESAPVDNTFDRSVYWNGRDNNGRMVDNGIYFFRANIAGKINWGKLVVIN